MKLTPKGGEEIPAGLVLKSEAGFSKQAVKARRKVVEK
jgi:hypothetical protein